jgi:hypothetical protein
LLSFQPLPDSSQAAEFSVSKIVTPKVRKS